MFDEPIPEGAVDWQEVVALRGPPTGLEARRWNPYLTGAGIGVLSWFTFWTMHRALGASSTYVHVGAAVAALATPDASGDHTYYQHEITKQAPLLDWQAMLLVGVFIGAWLSSRIGRDRSPESVPALWAWRFGPSPMVRASGAFVGGALLLFGARLAGGCTSGHGISGTMQLAVSSWVFLIAMFATGIPTAYLMFGREGRRHVSD
jgi:uncharacterized membrane protein YedE/YeeE